MPEPKVFVSVGGTATPHQEEFVRAVEDRLRSEGMSPHTVGRNTFSSDAPLRAVEALMNECSGTVVIGLERTYFPKGIERRGGPKERALTETRYPTPWNQIEAAMAYAKGLLRLALVEEGVNPEGLLEPGYDWYVQTVTATPAALGGAEFNGVLASWRTKVLGRAEKPAASSARPPRIDAADMTIGQIAASLRPGQAWKIGVLAAGIVGGAFSLGARLFGP